MRFLSQPFIGSWWFRVPVLFAWTFAAQWFLIPGLYFTGDEPHYMMSVVSFLKDGDFNNYNNYQQGDYKLFAMPELEPQWRWAAKPGLIPAEHGTLFPLLLAPAYAWKKMAGVWTLLCGCALLACFFVAAAVDLLSGSRAAGTAAAILLAISPTWQMQASRVYPETFAGLLVSALMLLLAIHAVHPNRRSTAAEVFAVGFGAAFLVVLYTKYVAFTGAFALAIAFLPRLRIRRELYAGVAAALAIALLNYLLWAEQGAFFKGYEPGNRHPFAIAGMFQRYWRPWFDQYHGLFVFQPYTILVLWAIVRVLRKPQNDRQAVISAMGAAALFYTAMHAIWRGSPGHGVPGRYLTAMLPVVAVLIVLWACEPDRWRAVRIGAILGGVGVVVAFIVQSLVWQAPPYFVCRLWIELFDRYWVTWEPGSEQQIKPVGLIGYLTALSVLLTKCVARLQPRSSTPNVPRSL